jgi:hypothetical protein
MWVRIFVIRFAVGSPAGVADANSTAGVGTFNELS